MSAAIAIEIIILKCEIINYFRFNFYKNISDTNVVYIVIVIISFVIFYSIIIPIVEWSNMKNQKSKHPIAIYIIIVVSIIIYFIGFIWYNEESKRIYKTSLNGITNMYYNTVLFDTNSIVSNHNFINNRILFLEERIVHYQNDSNHFASLWLALLSVLFITVTGFNLYNYSEQKKTLDRDIEKLENILKNNESYSDNQKTDDVSTTKGLLNNQGAE